MSFCLHDECSCVVLLILPGMAPARYGDPFIQPSFLLIDDVFCSSL